MLPAPRLADLRAHNDNHPGAMCCLLFAPPFSGLARDEVVARLGYLDSRTSKHIDFYCAGYGGYWHQDDYPDMESIGTRTYKDGTAIPWAFSQTAFANFVDELQTISSWKYQSETEIIVLNAVSSFKDCLVLRVDRMIEDGALAKPSELFESLISYASSAPGRASSRGYSNSKLPGIFGSAVLNFLTEGPKALLKALQSGRHYAVRSIEK